MQRILAKKRDEELTKEDVKILDETQLILRQLGDSIDDLNKQELQISMISAQCRVKFSLTSQSTEDILNFLPALNSRKHEYISIVNALILQVSFIFIQL